MTDGMKRTLAAGEALIAQNVVPTERAIGRYLGITHTSVNWHLGRLKAAGLVDHWPRSPKASHGDDNGASRVARLRSPSPASTRRASSGPSRGHARRWITTRGRRRSRRGSPTTWPSGRG